MPSITEAIQGGIVASTADQDLVRQGRLYFVNRHVEASSAALAIHIKTGAKAVNYRPSTSTGGKVVVNIIEGVTATVDGTAIVSRNYNRNKSDDGGLTRAFYAPTYTGGTVIKINQSGFGSSPGHAVPGASSAGLFYKLKPNTSYVFLQTPAASTDQVYTADYYED